MIKICWHDQSS